YPNSARNAEAYLKLGTAFSRLNQQSEACKVFKTLKSKYPTAAPAVLQRTDVEMARIDCR
ncbi:MAG: tol-pal system protein YbgF, partial [Parvularculaceae bacterium]|nr:tol-pal system protein YbgF [Parvularculaceae bacterium]